MRVLITSGVLFILGITASICSAAPKKAAPLVVNQQERNAAYNQLFTRLFYQWDHNKDGKIDLKEINTAIADASVRGNDSAIAVVLHNHISHDDATATNGLTLDQFLALSSDPQMQKAITGSAKHIASINHALFAGNDPSLAVFHQGRMGDCYLLAMVGDYTYQHPDGIRKMIGQGADGKYDIHFGNGRDVAVDSITDAELIMGAAEGRDHGIWLSVMEKAFARMRLDIKEEKTGEETSAGDAVFSDLIGHGGSYGPVIALLSGHKAAGAPMGKWLKSDPKSAMEKMDALLTRLSQEHRMMAVGTGHDKSKSLPKGIAHGHAFAVLEYSPGAHLVKMFNPWGNHFKPTGIPGIENGYPTRHGIFEVPLLDFMTIFGGFAYETDKIASR